MTRFKTGDLVAKKHPVEDIPLQTGLVVSHDLEKFTVRWTSFHKVFFMEKEGDIFAELNKTFLLRTEDFFREKEPALLYLLNSNYNNEQQHAR